MPDEPGTRFSTLLASTSWNLMPANSGVVTERTQPGMPVTSCSPGSELPSRAPSACPSHLMHPFEHTFGRRTRVCDLMWTVTRASAQGAEPRGMTEGGSSVLSGARLRGCSAALVACGSAASRHRVLVADLPAYPASLL